MKKKELQVCNYSENFTLDYVTIEIHLSDLMFEIKTVPEYKIKEIRVTGYLVGHLHRFEKNIKQLLLRCLYFQKWKV